MESWAIKCLWIQAEKTENIIFFSSWTARWNTLIMSINEEISTSSHSYQFKLKMYEKFRRKQYRDMQHQIIPHISTNSRRTKKKTKKKQRKTRKISQIHAVCWQWCLTQDMLVKIKFKIVECNIISILKGHIKTLW